jgi:hypothetical protein
MSIFGSDQYDRLKATLTILFPFILMVVIIFFAYQILLTDRKGSIHVVSNIPGAEIFLSSSPSNQKTDATLRHLRPDAYDISVHMDGYLSDPIRQLVQVKRGETAEVHFRLMKDTTIGMEPAPELTQLDTASHSKSAREWLPSLDSLKKVRENQRKTEIGRTQLSPSYRKADVSPDPSVFTSVSVTSSRDGAMIIVDDVETGFTTPANLILNRGIHTIQVQMDGYQADPPKAEIVSSYAGQRDEVHFQLSYVQAAGDSFALVISTEPAEGRIFVDDRFCAEGVYKAKSLNPGEYLVSFGSVDGYTTPESQKIVISQDAPYAHVVGTYRPIVYISASLDDKGQLIEKGVDQVVTGVFFQPGGFSSDDIRGPAVKFLEGNKFYAWELGYADAEKNPPGSDGIEFVFTVPKGFDRDKNTQLRIYGYASNRNYPFTFLNKTEIAIYINGSGVNSNFKPTYNVDEERALGYDEFDISPFLKEGENRLLIRTTSDSRCYYYLNKIVIL